MNWLEVEFNFFYNCWFFEGIDGMIIFRDNLVIINKIVVVFRYDSSKFVVVIVVSSESGRVLC